MPDSCTVVTQATSLETRGSFIRYAGLFPRDIALARTASKHHADSVGISARRLSFPAPVAVAVLEKAATDSSLTSSRSLTAMG